MKKYLPYAVLAIIIAVFGFSGLTVASANHTETLTVCHKTASVTNPWVEQTINANELQSHLANGDFVVDFWHHCPPVTPTPTVSPTPTESPTPSVSPTPTDVPCITWDKEIPVPCVTPTPTATPEATPTPDVNTGGGSAPTFAGSSTNAPVCGDGSTVQLPANPHVIRQGTDATVNFFITEGDSANIYVRLTGQADWNNAVTSARDVKPNSDNFVSYTFHDLDANQGYDFGVQQKQGCGGGQLVTAVVVDGASYKPVLFKFSFWEWSK